MPYDEVSGKGGRTIVDGTVFFQRETEIGKSQQNREATKKDWTLPLPQLSSREVHRLVIVAPLARRIIRGVGGSPRLYQEEGLGRVDLVHPREPVHRFVGHAGEEYGEVFQAPQLFLIDQMASPQTNFGGRICSKWSLRHYLYLKNSF